MNFVENVGLWLMIIGLSAVVGVAVLWVLGILRLVVVEEGTAVLFKYLGRFCSCEMEFAGKHFDADGEIQDGPGLNRYGGCWCIWRVGGWVFFIHPFVKPIGYCDYNDEGDGFGHGIYVHLGDVASNPKTMAAETTEADGSSIPLDVKFTSKMRVRNPYKFLIVSPKDVAREAIEDRQVGVLKSWVRSGDRTHALSARGNGTQIWSELGTNGLLESFNEARTDWGLEIVPNSIITKEVGFETGYQEAMEAESKAKLKAKGSVAETTGRVMEAVAAELGMTVEELKKKQKKTDFVNSQAYRDALSFAKDMVKRDRAADAGDLLDVRIGTSDGGSLPSSLSYLSVGGGGGGVGIFPGNKNRGKGRGGKEGKGSPDSGDKNKPKQKKDLNLMTSEEIDDEVNGR